MASINFINLSTAQAIRRSREVGIRKVLGGSLRSRADLSGDGRNYPNRLLAFMTGLFLAEISLPVLQHIASVPASIPLLESATFPFMMLVIIFLIVLSGLYPALVLSGFRPVAALKNENKNKIQGRNLHGKSACCFTICDIPGIDHWDHCGGFPDELYRNSDLGFNKDQVLMMDYINDSTGSRHMETFKEDLRKIHGVLDVSISTDAPSSSNEWGSNFYFNNSLKELGFETDIKQANADLFFHFPASVCSRPDMCRAIQ